MQPLLQPQALPVRGYRGLIFSASHLQSLLLLAMRLYWGWQLWVSGTSHLGDVPTMMQRFTSWGIPFPTLNVYISGTMEAVGGLLLLVGFASRLVAIPLIGNFVVAYLTASRDVVVNIFNNPDGFVSDAAFLFLLTAVIVLVFGPGIFSVDGVLRYALKRYVPQVPVMRRGFETVMPVAAIDHPTAQTARTD